MASISAGGLSTFGDFLLEEAGFVSRGDFFPACLGTSILARGFSCTDGTVSRDGELLEAPGRGEAGLDEGVC